MASKINITVKAVSGQQIKLSVEPSATVEEVKKMIAAQSDFEADRLKLIYSGHIMANERTLESYGTPFRFPPFPTSISSLNNRSSFAYRKNGIGARSGS